MKWNKENQVPVEGTYTPLRIPGTELMQEVKKDLLDTVRDNTLWSHIQRSNAWDLLAGKTGMTFDEYLKGHFYRTEDTYNLQPMLLIELMYAASRFMPVERKELFLDIIGDTTLLGRIFEGLSTGDEMDLLSRVYFCESDEDVWDILLEGTGNPRHFVRGYAGFPLGLAGDDSFFSPARTVSRERLCRFVLYMTSHGANMDQLLFD